MSIKKYTKFMRESNAIEREKRLNPGDIEAVKFTLSFGLQNVNQILGVHKIVGDYLEEDWVGKWRKVNVRVGLHEPPHWTRVSMLMGDFVKKLPYMDSWEAHNKFEMIHPFRDLNGRVGRLIWLSKAINEGYKFGIPFLQAYYYQTLSKEQGDDS